MERCRFPSIFLDLFEIISAEKHVLIFLSSETTFALFFPSKGGGTNIMNCLTETKYEHFLLRTDP